MIKILKRIKELKLDRGTKIFNLQFRITKINIDNHADNVIPGQQTLYLIYGLMTDIQPGSLKRKLNTIFRSITKKAKCKFRIQYEVSGESFLTKPNNHL